jgi:hypothetical protein
MVDMIEFTLDSSSSPSSTAISAPFSGGGCGAVSVSAIVQTSQEAKHNWLTFRALFAFGDARWQ